MIRRCARALGALLLLSVGTIFAAEEPRPIKSSPAAYGAAETAPGNVATNPAQSQEERMLELLRQAETWRGLRSKEEVPSATLDEKQLAKEVAASFREDLPADALRSTEVSLKAFGLIPEDLDLAVFLPKLLTREIAGYYDPQKDAMSLVVREGGVLGGREDGAGLDAQQAEDMVLVHELTHALQDQHFDLERFTKTDPLSDEATARQALVEGDATLTMLNALVGIPFEELPGAAGLLEKAMGASGDLMTGSSEELAEAPPYISETLIFSYAQGYLFCISVRQAGGQKLLDHAFRTDPPRSSEQILHPEKWHGRRDDPIDLTWPDLAAALPGYTKAAEGEMGELSIRILLREALRDQERAETAAAGWGGDRFAVYETGGGKDRRRLLAWITEWDSEKDAAELADAARQLGAGWRVEQPSPQRVVILRGELSEKQVRPVLQRLAKAAAQRPANKDIDLAAPGIRDEDRAGSNPEKLMQRLQDPEVRERITTMTGQLASQEGVEGTIDEEGLSFASPTFSLRLPESAVAAGWHLEEAPSAGVILVAQAGDDKSWIGFGQQNLPADVFSMEDVLALFETGFSASIPGYKSLGGKAVEVANGSAYESLFEAGGETAIRGVVRLYKRGSSLVFGAGMAQQENWKDAEPALRSVLEALTLAPEAP